MNRFTLGLVIFTLCASYVEVSYLTPDSIPSNILGAMNLVAIVILFCKFLPWFFRRILLPAIGMLFWLAMMPSDSNRSAHKSNRKETGFAVYRIYGSNRTYLGTWTSPNMAISNAESALRRSSKNTAVVVTDKETGGTIWSDNK